MKIGIYDPYLDDLGGGEKYMMSIAECLSKRHSVEVFWDNKGDVDELLKRFTLDLSSIKLTKNIFSPKIGFLKRIFETCKYDVIIVLSDGSIPFVLSKKLFIHFQSPIQQVRLGFKTKLKLSRVNSVFCNSQFTKSFIDKTFKINSRVVYPPVSLYPKETKKENMILHVGRFRVKNVSMTDYKKQGILVEAFKEMVEKRLKDWKLVLAVGVQEKNRLEFERLKETARGFPIEFEVNRNNEDLWELYNKAKIYWHASGFGEDLEKHPEYAEHFGISTVEAMGAGVVPVVINAGGQKEIIEDGISGFLWSTLEELQQKTLRLIRDDVLWKKLSTAAKKQAEYFAGSRFCKDIMRMIGNPQV